MRIEYMKHIGLSSCIVLGFALLLSGCNSTSEKMEKAVSGIDFSLIPCGNGNGLKYYADSAGDRVLEFSGKTEFGYADEIQLNLFNDGLALIRPRQRSSSGDPSWFIDREGNTVITTTDIAKGKVVLGGFYDGVAFIVNNDGKETVAINTSGEELYRFDGVPVSAMYGGFALYNTSRNDSWTFGAINARGEVVFEAGNQDEHIFFMDWERTYHNPAHPSQYPVIDSEGNFLYVIDLADGKHYLEGVEYESMGSSKRYPMIDWNNLAVYCEDEKYGLIDDQGNVVVEPQFDGMVNDGEWYLVSADGMLGWCDKTGKMKIDFQFDIPSRYGNKLPAETRFGADKWAYVESIKAFIDRNGDVALDCEYKPVTNFVGDRCIVALGGYRGCAWMGRDGELISEPFAMDDEQLEKILSSSTRSLTPAVRNAITTW